MKKSKMVGMFLFLIGGLALTNGNNKMVLAENGNVPISNFEAHDFADGWGATSSYVNEGVKVNVTGDKSDELQNC